MPTSESIRTPSICGPQLSSCLQSEEWRDVPVAENYQVSNLGRVRSLDRKTIDGRNVKGKILKQSFGGAGYKYVSLGAKIKISVHRLVAMAFLGMPEAKQEVSHLDGSKTNNLPSNLQ